MTAYLHWKAAEQVFVPVVEPSVEVVEFSLYSEQLAAVVFL